MDKNLLRKVINKQKEGKDTFSGLAYIERSKAKYGQKWLESDLIKVILGPRRAGKSVFAFMLLKGQNFAYFNFDDSELTNERIDTYQLMEELHNAYGDFRYVLFDEIQNLPAWELFSNRLHRERYNLVLTGSNANLLSMELATHLTGRHVPIELLPFDFKEFLRAKNYTNLEQKRDLNLLEQYMIFGGFPEVVVKNYHPRGYLDVLFDALLFKDVVKRHKVRYSGQIDQLGSYLINNISCQYSFRKLANILKFKSEVTLEKYLKYLTEAYVVFSLSSFSTKTGERLKSPRKIYTVDNGFVAANAVQNSPDKGKFMENLIFVELVKKGYGPNRELFYYKTRNNREVDFVIKKGLKIDELIQACYEVANYDIEQRETKALLEAAEELKVEKITIVTWDEKREIIKDSKTIQMKPLWEWLLEQA